MTELIHSVIFDLEKCVACVACCKACPTRAIRIKEGRVVVKTELCIDCGECIRICPYDAVSARTSSPSDLKKFKYTVAVPSTTLFAQFGSDVQPQEIVSALTHVGFDAFFDMSWMCEMVGRAIDTYLSECKGPWPKISITCPAILRLIQIRYPDLLPHLVPFEVPRELTAKYVRRKLATERHIAPSDIGVFYTTPCSAIMQSIICPVGLDESYLDGAFSIAELYGPLLKAIKADSPKSMGTGFSPKGLEWAAAGGEIAMMRNTNTLALSGVQEITYVFDRIEAGKFQNVDFIEAYICPDGCVSGPLLIEGRYAAKRTIHEIAGHIGLQNAIKEEKVRSLFREHFFDIEEAIKARSIKPPAKDLTQAIKLKQEKTRLLAGLPHKDCAACGAPDCVTLTGDILGGAASINDCVFIRLQKLAAGPTTREPEVSRVEKVEESRIPARKGEKANMSNEMLVMDVTCPNCNDVLTEGRRVHLDAYVKDTNQDGEIFLSAIFGDYAIQTDLDVPEGATAEFRCPTCDQSLMLNIPCKLCGATMASLNLKGGGYLEFCCRHGCTGHALGGFGDIDQMITLVNQMLNTPHD